MRTALSLIAAVAALMGVTAHAVEVADPGFAFVDVDNNGLYDDAVDVGLMDYETTFSSGVPFDTDDVSAGAGLVFPPSVGKLRSDNTMTIVSTGVVRIRPGVKLVGKRVSVSIAAARLEMGVRSAIIGGSSAVLDVSGDVVLEERVKIVGKVAGVSIESTGLLDVRTRSKVVGKSGVFAIVGSAAVSDHSKFVAKSNGALRVEAGSGDVVATDSLFKGGNTALVSLSGDLSVLDSRVKGTDVRLQGNTIDTAGSVVTATQSYIEIINP